MVVGTLSTPYTIGDPFNAAFLYSPLDGAHLLSDLVTLSDGSTPGFTSLESAQTSTNSGRSWAWVLISMGQSLSQLPTRFRCSHTRALRPLHGDHSPSGPHSLSGIPQAQCHLSFLGCFCSRLISARSARGIRVLPSRIWNYEIQVFSPRSRRYFPKVSTPIRCLNPRPNRGPVCQLM